MSMVLVFFIFCTFNGLVALYLTLTKKLVGLAILMGVFSVLAFADATMEYVAMREHHSPPHIERDSTCR